MNKENQSFLAAEKAGKLMLKYSVPCIISLLVGALYNIVDQIFIQKIAEERAGSRPTTFARHFCACFTAKRREFTDIALNETANCDKLSVISAGAEGELLCRRYAAPSAARCFRSMKRATNRSRSR